MTSALVTNEWKRYGKHRLYVSDGAGSKVGWFDLTTWDEHLDQPDLAAAFRATIAAALGGPTATTATTAARATPSSVPPSPAATLEEAASPAEPEAALPPPPPAPVVRDLAYVHPGAAAREQAELHAAEARANGRFRFFLQRALDVKTDERAWRIGAQGEEIVGARLDKLAAKGWRTLHAVPVGERGSDIDHVVIGPGGVFTVNTKTHPGGEVWVGERAVLVNGSRTDYLRNSRFEAKRTAALLERVAGAPVHVHPLIAVAGADRLRVKAQPKDVTVVASTLIHRWLLALPDRLSPVDVEALHGWARLSTTWVTA